jgi:hypothetical protein
MEANEIIKTSVWRYSAEWELGRVGKLATSRTAKNYNTENSKQIFTE